MWRSVPVSLMYFVKAALRIAWKLEVEVELEVEDMG